MNGTQVLLQLVGSVALLVWGVRLVRTGVTRALGAELRRLVALSARNRVSAFASGLCVTGLLQSSTATALIVGSFAGRGLIALPMGLALMLGADVGSTLAAALLSFDVRWLWSAFAGAGVVLFMSRDGERPKGFARALLGVGLMLLALKELGATAAFLKDSPVLRLLGDAGGDPVLGFLAAALLTWLAHSSIAIVLLVMALAGAGAIAPPLALVLVLGANLGGAFAPWLMLAGSPPAARRVPLGNLVLRGCLAVAALPLAWGWGGAMAGLAANEAQAVVLFHIAFNGLVATVGLPLVTPLARLVTRLQPERSEGAEEAGVPRHLDPSVLDTPSEALACAMRETLRLGDQVGGMLRVSLAAIEGNEARLVRDVERADDAIDRLHEAIKLYLVKASKAEMSDDESRRFVEILGFTTNLEHIGDIIDKNLMELAGKKIRRQASFSPEGAAEIRAFHAHLEDTMRLALNVFATRDVALARRLFAQKAVTRGVERSAAESHFTRLRDGRPESLETSAIHLDILRDFKRIHGHLTAVAYPILEAEGELAESRLRGREPGAIVTNGLEAGAR